MAFIPRQRPMAVARSRPWNMAEISERVPDITMAAPTPMATHAAISSPRLGAIEAHTAPREKTARPRRYTRWRPKMLPNTPPGSVRAPMARV